MGVMVAIFSITLSSCKKESQDTEMQDLTSVEESAVASETYFDTFADISSLSTENDGLFSTSGSAFQIMDASSAISTSCAIISISPQNGTWP